jgi:hypothetical protein
MKQKNVRGTCSMYTIFTFQSSCVQDHFGCFNAVSSHIVYFRWSYGLTQIPSFLRTGQHVINLFVQYTPYTLSEGSWQDPTVRVS